MNLCIGPIASGSKGSIFLAFFMSSCTRLSFPMLCAAAPRPGDEGAVAAAPARCRRTPRRWRRSRSGRRAESQTTTGLHLHLVAAEVLLGDKAVVENLQGLIQARRLIE